MALEKEIYERQAELQKVRSELESEQRKSKDRFQGLRVLEL